MRLTFYHLYLKKKLTWEVNTGLTEVKWFKYKGPHSHNQIKTMSSANSTQGDVSFKSKDRDLSEHRSGVTGALLISSQIKSQLFAVNKGGHWGNQPPQRPDGQRSEPADPSSSCPLWQDFACSGRGRPPSKVTIHTPWMEHELTWCCTDSLWKREALVLHLRDKEVVAGYNNIHK